MAPGDEMHRIRWVGLDLLCVTVLDTRVYKAGVTHSARLKKQYKQLEIFARIKNSDLD